MSATNVSCRLCLCACTKYKALQNEYGHCNEIYDIASKYFDTKLLTTIVCLDCWDHIDEFHKFQQTVFEAHRNLENVEEIEETLVKVEEIQLIDKGNDCIDESQKVHLTSGISMEDYNPFSSDDDIPLINKSRLFKEKGAYESNLKYSESQFEEDIDPHPNNPTDFEEEEERKFQCDICDKGYKYKKGLGQHMILDHSEQSFIQCPHCPTTIKGNSSLRRHMRRKHSEKYDDFISKSQEEENEHIDTGDQNDSIQFEEEKKSNTESKIDSNIFEPEEYNKFKCTLCNNVYEYNIELRKHMTLDHTADSMIQCLYCEKIIKGRGSMRRHQRTLHPKEYKKIITKSGQQITNIDDFISKSQEEEKPTDTGDQNDSTLFEEENKSNTEYKIDSTNFGNIFKCTLCNNVYEYNVELRKHMTLDHTVESMIQCLYCEKIIKGRGSMRRHQRTLHPKEYNKFIKKSGQQITSNETSTIQCPYCIKRLVGNSSLYRHIKRLHPEKYDEYIMKYKKETDKNNSKSKESIDVSDQNVSSSSTGFAEIKCEEKETAKISSIQYEKECNFKCTLCTNAYKYSIELRQHMTSNHTEQSVIQCLYCENTIKGKSSMRRHIRRIHPREYAESIQRSQEELIEYKGDGKFKCIICSDKVYEQYKELREHMTLQHPGKSLYQCPYCPKSFDGYKKFPDHIKKRHPKEFEESSINKRHRERAKLLANFLQNYNSDIKSNEANDDSIEESAKKPQYLVDLEYDAFIAKWQQELECDVCKVRTFGNLSLLFQHFRQEHPDIKGYVSCCGRKLATRPSLVEHIIIHVDPNTFKCKICDKFYSGFDSLDDHMRLLHSDGKDCPFECNVCTKRFLSHDKLLLHAGVHSTVKTHICKICNKGFANKVILSKHITRCHRGKQTHLCHQCGKSFNVFDALKQHLLKHAGIEISKPKPNQQSKNVSQSSNGLTLYVCKECGKKYKSKLTLTQHKKHDHLGERKFRCRICYKTFKYAQVLRDHQGTHTKETPYTCPHCPTKFSRKQNIRRHLQVFHPNEFAEGNVRKRAKVDLSLVVNEVVI